MLGPLRRFNRWSDQRLLVDLPEYDLFPSEEARNAAVKEIDEGLEQSSRFWISIVIVVVTLIAASIVARVILNRLTSLGSGWISLIVIPAAILIGYVFVVWIWRLGVARSLRGKLVEAGVPVCLRCGYDLRGTPEPRCPECGWRVNEVVRRAFSGNPGRDAPAMPVSNEDPD